MSNEIKLDAAENMFFSRELEFIERELLQIQRTPLKGLQLLPLASGVSEEDERYTFRMQDRLGEAKRVADYSTDLPLVNIKDSEESVELYDFGAAFGYSFKEIKQAAKLGRSLDRERMDAAREVIERKVEDICATGDSAAGIKGLLNLSNTSPFTLTTKAATGTHWIKADGSANATAQEVLNDLNGMYRAVREATVTTESVTRFVMPDKYLQFINELPRTATSDITVANFFRSTRPGVELMSWEKLLGADAGSKDMVMGYNPDARRVRLVMPNMFRMESPERRGMSYIVNCLMTTGGVVSPYPKSIVYSSGGLNP